jgi:hypothetical protein
MQRANSNNPAETPNIELRRDYAVNGKGRIVLDNQTDTSISLVGGKGKSLLRMKAYKDLEGYNIHISVPQFFIVSPEVNLAKNQRAIKEAAKSLGTELFAVRSSYLDEDTSEHNFDGIFESKLKVPLEMVTRAIHEVRKSAITEKSKRYASENKIDLKDEMPVVVQAMVNNPEVTGVIYSKFPCPNNIAKMVTRSGDGREYVDAFTRDERKGHTLVNDTFVLLNSGRFDFIYGSNGITQVVQKVIDLEKVFGYPIISEFAYNYSYKSDEKPNAFLLQGRRINGLTEAEKFNMPQLLEKGFLGKTESVNGVGDVTGQAFVCHKNENLTFSAAEDITTEEYLRLEKFDAEHKEGYILVAPYLKFYVTDLDEVTPNKKAVVAYSDLGWHHDYEIARAKGILYLGFDIHDALNEGRIEGSRFLRYDLDEPLIRDGDTLRVVGDGLQGFVYNLSKK